MLSQSLFIESSSSINLNNKKCFKAERKFHVERIKMAKKKHFNFPNCISFTREGRFILLSNHFSYFPVIKTFISRLPLICALPGDLRDFGLKSLRYSFTQCHLCLVSVWYLSKLLRFKKTQSEASQSWL